MSSSNWECALASTSRRRIFSAPAMASEATWSRSCSRARVRSCSISALAAAFSRLPSSLATLRASSMICAARLSACARISVDRARASWTVFSACRLEVSSDFLPCSPAARPSAIVFWRSSIARRSGGQTNLTVNQMNAAKTIACAKSVKLMFMLRLRRFPNRSAESRQQRVARGEPQRKAHADDEGRVDQAEEQEHLALQRVGELGLARGGFEEAAAHDAHADAGARGPKAHHQADADPRVGLHHRQQLKLVHWFFSFPKRDELVVFVRHRDVHDGEHHENVGLQKNNQDVEDRPAQAEQHAQAGPAEPRGGEQPQEQEDQLARVHVAEQTQRVRKRLRHILDE